jgi:predicted HTH domain antitoxin
MRIDLEDDLLKAAGLSAQELMLEVAVLLFRRGVTLAQASYVADLPIHDFMHELARREIAPHYDVSDVEQDLEVLDRERRA